MIEMSEVKAEKEAVRKSLAEMSLNMITEAFHPLDRLRETIDKKEWFKGLILSTTFFEMCGFIILTSYFELRKKGPEHRKIVTEFFKRISVSKLLQLLYLCDFIELGTYRKMNAINKERNLWVHRKKHEKNGVAYLIGVEQKDIKKIMKLISDAINCLKELGVRD